MQEKRRYPRESFDNPLCADMRIASINNVRKNSNAILVFIDDISVGGLKFSTTLHMPVNPNVTLEFSTRLNKVPISIPCIIKWRREVKPYEYSYGAFFIIDDATRVLLGKLIDDVSIALRTYSFVPDCRFCSREDKEKHIFEQMKKQNQSAISC